MVQIVPSILSADFARLAEDIGKVERGGATMLHVDIMDGHFVPNLTIGPPVVKSIRKTTKLTLDVHLMITDPDKYAPLFIEAGADQVSVHYEAATHLDRTHPDDSGRGREGGRGAQSGDAGERARRHSLSGGLRADYERQSRVSKGRSLFRMR